ncbi:MAG TPA: ABC transporter ATP-binding protein [Pyrinomonadaceae bacterium]|nr:ABC transporter ATP-binding protein [Pyrinomonadaceae bacterium]
MRSVIVRCRQLSKRYEIRAFENTAPTLREAVMGSLHDFWRPRVGSEKFTDWLWVLRNVNFDIYSGEIVGIIGRNGAGKSTLLRILSRVTTPTHGEVDIYGRVGSLLEIGTGFHPDLTGHENIYLNAAILGMRRAEIDSKLDQIVAFSEIRQFLHMPVKFYSSGMYLRLAFSIAAHVEANILLVDEALSVGDAGFQQKCKEKMEQLKAEGRTVLLVTHDMSAVARLCDRVFLISNGLLTETTRAAKFPGNGLNEIAR